jgi:hypothetical protein
MPNASVKVESTTDSNSKVTEAMGDFKVETGAPEETIKTASVEETQSAENPAHSEGSENEDSQSAKEESEEESLEASANEAAEESESKVGKKKSGFQKRLDKLTKRAADERREKEYWKQEALKNAKAQPGEQIQSAKETPKAADTSKKPDSKDFETHDEYNEALTDWKVDQRLAREKASQRELELKGERDKVLKTHLDRVSEFKKSTPEFEDAMEDIRDMPISNLVQSAIVDSEFGPQIMLEFAKNPEELLRLNAMTEGSVGKAIGRMEARFEKSSEGSKAETPAETSAAKVTKAPKPISPLNSKAVHTKSIRDELPYDEWVKVRRAELKEG